MDQNTYDRCNSNTLVNVTLIISLTRSVQKAELLLQLSLEIHSPTLASLILSNSAAFAPRMSREGAQMAGQVKCRQNRTAPTCGGGDKKSCFAGLMVRLSASCPFLLAKR